MTPRPIAYALALALLVPASLASAQAPPPMHEGPLEEGPIEEGPIEDGPTAEGPLSDIDTQPQPPTADRDADPNDDTKDKDDEDDDEDDEEERTSRVVVVTGTRTAKDIDSTPVRTQVIDNDAIVQRRAVNLADAMRYTSGVRVETNCQNCGFTQLRLNGLDGHYTQILIDGLPTFSGLAGVYGLEQLPPELIERVEVVKGGGSALYGASAVAGVVNVITRRPRTNFGHVQVNAELIDGVAPTTRLAGDVGLITPDRTLALYTFASVRQRDPLDLNNDGFTELTRLNQLSGGANAYITFSDSVEGRVAFHGLQEYRRGGDQLDLPPHQAQIAEELETSRLQLEARLNARPSNDVDLNLAYAIAHTDRRSYYGGGGGGPLTPPDPDNFDPDAYADFLDAYEAQTVADGGYGRTRNPTHAADVHTNIYLTTGGSQIITTGLQLQIDDIEDRYLAYDRVLDVAYTTYAAYAQHNWIFADWGESVVGARVDQHSEVQDPIVSPRVALRFTPSDAVRLRSAFSMGFRAPQAFDEDLHIETVGGSARLITNAPDLEVERSLSFTQQVEGSWELGRNLDLRLGVNGYATLLNDAFVVNEADDPTTPEEEALRTNRGTTRAVGVELTGDLETRYVALRLGWTFEDARNEDPDEDFGQVRILRTPRSYGYAELLAQVSHATVQAGVDLTGPMPVPRYDAEGNPEVVNTSPWFADVNMNASWRFKLDGSDVHIDPFVGVRNLLNAYQDDIPVGPTRDAGYVYGPALPRTVFAGVRGGL